MNATGYGLAMTTTVQDVPDAERFEAFVDGALAGVATYHLRGGRIALRHTEVDDAFEGHGVGSALARHALGAAREAGLAVLPYCPFMASYIREHPEWVDLVPEDLRSEFGLAEGTA